MELITIREVSQGFGISTRTLRYYEEVGLLQSTRQADSAYRAYDGEALRRLKQILVLRALRLPLRQIRLVLQGDAVCASLALLEQHAHALGREMATLGTLRVATYELMEALRAQGLPAISLDTLDEATARKLVRLLAIPTAPTIKEEPVMPKLTDVRIVYLPPATVCAIHRIGPEAELEAGNLLDAFAVKSKLKDIKPDMRVYGFNHPNGTQPDGSDHGYELWITIPDDMTLEAPYEKKRFEGGLYAAHMIPLGAFEEWPWIVQWVEESPDYAPRWGAEACMAGLLEEHLNYIHHIGQTQGDKDKTIQLDLLVPISEKA